MVYSVRFTSGAERDFRKIPKEDARRIRDSLIALAHEESPKSRVKKLKGVEEYLLYSFRVGSYRLILAIEDEHLVVFVIEIGDRRNIYRKY